ncbi:MAG: hypothetical protein JWO77_645 [Ilumatobacteraceae bacterium]|nr:hypothetical protein [Ilumatobacteraceae bacterium]
MGDEDTDHDSIWTPAPDAPVDPAPEAGTDAGAQPGDDDGLWVTSAADEGGDAELFGPVTEDGDPDDLWGPITRAGEDESRTSQLRIALGVGCLVIAAIAMALLVTRDDGSKPTPSATMATAPKSDASVLSSSEDADKPALVPSTLPEGAVVKCGDWDVAASFAPQTIPEGVAIWSDFDGWHVRASGTEVGTVTGRITGTVRPNLLDQVEPERVDAAAPPEGTELYFTIRPGEQPEGFDFTAGCSQKAFTFEIKSDAQPTDPALIHLGKAGGVESVPFIVSRIPEPS